MQRVAIGRALVRRPKALLMDEPIGALDAKLREEMRTELKRMHLENDATTVYVTHDQVEAMSLADRIAIMNDGILQQVGTPDEVYHRPANLFVAQFIGSPVMNISRATISAEGKTIRLVLGEGAAAFDFPEGAADPHSTNGTRPARTLPSVSGRKAFCSRGRRPKGISRSRLVS